MVWGGGEVVVVVSKHASIIVSKSLKNYNLFFHPTFWQYIYKKNYKDIHLQEIKT